MPRLHAAAWVAPTDERDRGNLLGAAVVAAQRSDRDIAAIVEGADAEAAAIAAARETGLLIVPALDQVMPEARDAGALLDRAQAEGWRLMLLSLGADSDAPSGRLAASLLSRMADIPDQYGLWPVPPTDLRHRVGGGERTFHRSGLLHVECFESSLTAAGVRLADATDLLEWGAGCGRMSVHLRGRAPDARYTAADTDAEAIAWVGSHLAVDAAVSLPVLPPSDLAGDGFDLVVGHSVFSHLGVEAQDAWLAELARVTRAGGHVAVSFNGPAALAWHLEHPLVDVPRAVEEDVRRDGVAVWRGDGWEDEFYEGYHTTFHTHAYIREHWARWFDVVAIDEAAALPTQDIAVLRARSTAS